ncbi:hypothetical protein [Sphingomonas melonis]|jgi:hypothetical protein|uniref:hypothetical protein n=1 Tax=Sphingomonas melonis TaxID=152682 RepID=UPI000364902E|nr:hypothetical protein [Sphingomonas melonis]
MTLADFLSEHELSYAAFGRMIGTKYARTVERYAKGQQPPNPEMLRRIYEATAGVVTPNDFFPFASAPAEARLEKVA